MRHLCPLLKKLNHCARFSKRFAHSIGLFVNLPSGQRLEIQSLARWYAWSCAHLAKKWLGRWSFPGCLSIDPCWVLPHNVQTTEYEAMTSQPQLIVQELDENGSWCQCLESPKNWHIVSGKGCDMGASSDLCLQNLWPAQLAVQHVPHPMTNSTSSLCQPHASSASSGTQQLHSRHPGRWSPSDASRTSWKQSSTTHPAKQCKK